jgi:hypothetical protein
MYLGDADAPQTAANQEQVAAGKFTSLFRWLGMWRRVAYWWLTGSDRTSGWSTYATSYVDRVMDTYYGSNRAAPATDDIRRFSERSASIEYDGSWRQAASAAYAGGAVRYSTVAGARAVFAFTGSRIAWVGPTGPTRGKARITVDGRYVKTIDLYRSIFTARRTVYSTSWDEPGRHTLEIEVVGGGSHPMVAIDELLVTD